MFPCVDELYLKKMH